jgi:hypothetical protein
MSVWLPGARLDERRAASAGPLAPLAGSLAADLEPVLARDLVLPPEKARLSRDGGRCPADATYLRFDPTSPRRHLCPRCGRTNDDEVHYRWWIWGYHLWLVERAVHAAALHALAGDVRHRAFAERVLDAYADAYLRYPNQDNVLGPTRPFFSTYLESIWLLQLCVTVDLLERVSAPGVLGARVRERLIAPSAELIAGYDEGGSNRQVWNNAALLAAHLLLGRPERAEPLVWGASGLATHLSTALLPDGTWYEGENYHQFAHRGLWYGVALAEAAGQGPLPDELLRRFDDGFAAPFLTALPDFTAPSRRDSQYAVSLRQWRFAEMAELGLARRPGDRRLLAALGRLYAPDAPKGDTDRWRATAEAERNEPPVRLTRADLGWRSLLGALPELPALQARAPGSVLLEGQGLAVFRRDAGRVFAALDYGESGGGHGHPDRLNVMLAVGDERVLDDPGTGSYVDPSLHWYRSTLAHHAPIVDGRDQRRVSGRLLAFEERGGAGWVDALVEDVAPAVTLRRALVMMPGYLVDELTWGADGDRELSLPIHGGSALDVDGGWRDAQLDADGASHLSGCQRLDGTLEGTVALRDDEGRAVAWFTGDAPVTWWRAMAPGAPGRPPQQLHLAQSRGRVGRLRAVWSWDGAVTDVVADGDALRVRTADGGEHRHARLGDGWRVDLTAGGARSSIDLAGVMRDAATPTPASDPSTTAVEPPVLPLPARFELGEAHYRRSEQGWTEAGRPGATVRLGAEGDRLRIGVAVHQPIRIVVPAGAVNDMDNERPEINGDGIQLHLALVPRAPTGSRVVQLVGWLLLPPAAGAARVVPLDRPAASVALDVAWSVGDDGYAVDAAIGLAALREATGVPDDADLLADVIVNETAPGRERRRGQLVLSGARGEFVYLRGDRHDAARCLRFQLPS